jgi:predicted alpha/beta superfamily hydrolase
MKHLLTFILIFLCAQTYGQNNNNKIVIGTIDTIHSTILNEQREVLIYVPNSANTGMKGKTKYPVMYILDGESFFHSTTGMVQYLSAIGKMPQMIIVAIVNTDRVRDLTPTHYTSWSDGQQDPEHFKYSGGGEKFTSFIQKELIAHIDSLYPTEPYRMFVGHSLGGLMVINTLINHPSLFSSYVAIDPTIWWDKHFLIKKSESALKRTNYAGKRLFFASANTMNKGMDTIRVLTDTAIGNMHVRDNLRYRAILLENKNNNLVWNWKYYPEDDHPSVPLIAEYDALRSFFKDYELPKDVNDPSITADFIRDHYQNVSATLGYKVLPSQSTVNFLGYINLSNKQYDKAYSFFRMNIDNYPESFNVYDSMGDYYVARTDKRKAIEVFNKALTLQENPDTRKKLEALKSGR